MRRYVLDANAVLIYFGDRNGAKRVQSLLQESLHLHSPLLMSAVNWGEVIYSVWKRGGETEARTVEKNAARLPLLILPADRERAANAAEVKARHDLGYADSFAAALALEYSATLVTADPEFAKLGKRLAVLALPRHGSRG
ncbi:MAG: type II toxin-antitoxin system VapC family toxin [Candidatus Acidiferrales bacterium]